MNVMVEIQLQQGDIVDTKRDKFKFEKRQMKKRILSTLLSVIICSEFVTNTWALDNAKSAGKADGDEIVILCTNDVHCNIDQVTEMEEDKRLITNLGYSAVSAYKKDMEKAYGEDKVTLVDEVILQG